MKVLPGFVDMAHTPKEMAEEAQEYASPLTPSFPVYPYGLGICLGTDELEKLDLDTDVSVGDMLYMDCVCKVTSVSENETSEGVKKRVEMTITHIALEDAKEEMAEATMRKMDYKKLYKEAE